MSGGQFDTPLLRLRILPVEERRVPDRADAHAAALIRQAVAQCCALVAVGAEETQFHELMRPQKFLQLREEFRREPAAAELERWIEPLAETA